MQNITLAPILVFLGGGIGATIRYLWNTHLSRLLGTGFPWGTFSINIAGSFLMGLLVGWLALKNTRESSHLQLFLAIGVLGGFTTFSSYSLEVVMLWQRNEPLMAISYALASLLLGIFALVIGLWISRIVF